MWRPAWSNLHRGVGACVTRPAFPPPLGLGLAVLSVSFAAPLFRMAEAPPLTASFWRLAVAVAILALFSARAWPTWRHLGRQDWGLLVASGVALGFHFGLWVTSLFYTTVAASVALVTLQAVFVAMGAHFILGDRLSPRAWIGVMVAFAGAFIIAAADGSIAPDSRRALIGDALALAGGLGSAVYMLIGRRVRQRLDLVAYVTPVYAVAALTVLAFLPVTGQPFAPSGDRQFVYFVLLAAVPMLGGHTLANWCLRHMEAPVVATWILLEPVGAALLAWPILGEVPHWATALGGGLVIWGAMQTQRRASPAEAAVEPVG